MSTETMINFGSLEAKLPRLRDEWTAADPYPNCLMEGFLKNQICEELAAGFPEALRRTKKNPYAPKVHKDVKRKVGIRNPDQMTDLQRRFFEDVNDPRFLRFLEDLTGVNKLYPDEGLRGSGLHEIYPGGYLIIHADFNFHPGNLLLRRLNLILYLNADWSDEWNGLLELWPENFDGPPKVVKPLMNHAVLFETSEISWHGHPAPLATPEGTTRRSIAVYYYSEWPKGLERRPKTRYVLTPSQKAELLEKLIATFDTLASEKEAVAAFDEYQPVHVRAAYRELLWNQPFSFINKLRRLLDLVQRLYKTTKRLYRTIK